MGVCTGEIKGAEIKTQVDSLLNKYGVSGGGTAPQIDDNET